MGISERRLFHLVGEMYENAGEAHALSHSFGAFSKLLKCGASTLNFISDGEPHYSFAARHEVDDAFISAYQEHFKAVSPFRKRIDSMKPGGSFSRIDECTDEDFERTEIYQDLFRRHKIYNFEFHALVRNGCTRAGVSFARPKERKRFTPPERSALDLTLPHFSRILTLYLNSQSSRLEDGTLFGSLAKVPRGAFVVDQARRIVFHNQHGDEIAAADDGLNIDAEGRLTPALAADLAKFSALVDSVFKPDFASGKAFGGVEIVHRPSRRRPFQVLVSPLPPRPEFGGRNLALVFVHDPDREVALANHVLEKLYQLTPSEANVASRLAAGRSLEQICTELAITTNTCRTHLKRVFSKTETNRQGELINLILTGPASLASESDLRPKK